MKTIRFLAIALLILVAVNALVAGYLFMADPSGHSLGISVNMLRFSAFENFFLPGLVLFTVNGVLGLITTIALIRRWPYYPVRVSIQGLLLTGWIVIQVLVIREFNFLHAILGSAGLFLIVAGIVLLKHQEQ
jgi:hypothetical protein